MTDVVLGLGTNLGDRLAHLRRAVRALRAKTPRLVVSRVSPIYESEALVPPDAPRDWCHPYLNLALLARFEGSVGGLLELAKETERELGRRPAPRWAPREADIDILVFGSERLELARVSVPHEGLAERPFALLPLADVWPDWRFPDGTPLAGLDARTAAARWPGDPDLVPFRTRRSGLMLTELVGIVNLTPDSFSDGGSWSEPERAVEHALGLAAAGATVIDLGAESTRPGALPVAPADEWARLAPVLGRLGATHSGGPRVCVDTRHGETARRALDAGADWINDVTGFADPSMRDAVRDSAAELVAMHSLGIPPTRAVTLPLDRDPVPEIARWAAERLAALEALGIRRERIIIDPGLGFGKTADQSLRLLRGAASLGSLGVRVLVGHSRKSFLAGWFSPDEPGAKHAAARDPETATLSGILAGEGVDYLRVHDVAGSARALRAWALAAP
jgi:2-amino-4-hydroxy-6-hydroxymethyldihydropteridine diphosphokinase/dihydropteroate synthase